MTATIEKMKGLVQQVEDLREQMKEGGKDALADGAQELFAKYLQLKQFGWNQYTPYFNDGDACEFSVNREELYELNLLVVDADGNELNGEELENLLPYGSYSRTKTVRDASDIPAGIEAVEVPYRWNKDQTVYQYPNPDLDPTWGPLIADVVDFVGLFPDDVLRDLFGDHVEVVIKRDGGVDVSDYSHD